MHRISRKLIQCHTFGNKHIPIKRLKHTDQNKNKLEAEQLIQVYQQRIKEFEDKLDKTQKRLHQLEKSNIIVDILTFFL